MSGIWSGRFCFKGYSSSFTGAAIKAPLVYGGSTSASLIKTVSDDLNVSVAEDGSQVVEVPDDIFQESVPLWENLLIRKFLDATPHTAKVMLLSTRSGFLEISR